MVDTDPRLASRVPPPADPGYERSRGAQYPPLDDVVAAREGVRRTDVSYGPRTVRRAPGDTLADWAHGFVQRYGWRAYAVPILALVTVAALLKTTGVAGGSSAPPKTPPAAAATARTSPPVADGQIPLKDDAPSAGTSVDQNVLKGAALPAGDAYTTRGKGTFRTLPGHGPVVGRGHLWRYSIDVENGITGIDLAHFQRMVVTVLGDHRSWSGHGVAVQRVDRGPIDFHVTLFSSLTIRKTCGYTIPVETSCYLTSGQASGIDVNRVALNDARWVRGDAAYVGDPETYRLYMINHEVGHALGHMHAHQCLPGGLAPVMMQQTIGLRSAATGAICQPNPWPYPVDARGVVVKGAPGAEQPDTAGNNEANLSD